MAGKSSGCRARSHLSRALLWHFGQWRFRQESPASQTIAWLAVTTFVTSLMLFGANLCESRLLRDVADFAHDSFVSAAMSIDIRSTSLLKQHLFGSAHNVLKPLLSSGDERMLFGVE